MFRSLPGVRAQYHYLTLVAVSEFDEWKVMVVGPEATIHGARQFSQTRAQEHALAIAKAYIHEEKHEALSEPPELQWIPAHPGDWLKWQA